MRVKLFEPQSWNFCWMYLPSLVILLYFSANCVFLPTMLSCKFVLSSTTASPCGGANSGGERRVKVSVYPLKQREDRHLSHPQSVSHQRNTWGDTPNTLTSQWDSTLIRYNSIRYKLQLKLTWSYGDAPLRSLKCGRFSHKHLHPLLNSFPDENKDVTLVHNQAQTMLTDVLIKISLGSCLHHVLRQTHVNYHHKQSED